MLHVAQVLVLARSSIAPTPFDPLAALSENKKWIGKPIAKDHFSKLSSSTRDSLATRTRQSIRKMHRDDYQHPSGRWKHTAGVFNRRSRTGIGRPPRSTKL
jgi:hypothetical protein